VQHLRIVYRKVGPARYLSHLDLIATFEYAFRRAALAFELSEGFNPRPRMSVAAPLSLGHEGLAELLDITLRESVPPPEASRRLQAALPPGIEVVEVEELEIGRAPAAKMVVSTEYRVELAAPRTGLDSQVAELLGRDSLELDETRDGRTRRRDIRPFILGARAEGEQRLHLRFRYDERGTVRPEQVLEALGIELEGARYTRERIVLGRA